MPSFSFLRSSRRQSQQTDIDRDGSGSLDQDSTEKARRRLSKRDYFRSLLKRTSITPETNSSRGSQHLQSNPRESIIPTSPEMSTTPRTPKPDQNKPLPRRPPPGTPQAEEPKPSKKLERIISPIVLADLHKLFSGAPQFLARSEGHHHTGAPHPSVAFPWNSELEVRDLRDHAQIHDEAWSYITAWPHLTLHVSSNPQALKEHHEKHTAHFTPRCRERPNMLSMQGIERGTIGYAAALELGVADALNEPEGPDKSPEEISQYRRKFLNDKEGLRPLTDSALIDRLMSVSETYHEDPLKHSRQNVEPLYTELFTQVLYPPTTVTQPHDPLGLQVQIEALIHVLAAPNVWIDFGLVEWRIRVGQILWAPESELGDEIAVNNEVMHEPGTQKYWLLLQILLSCELLLRLDAISMNIDHHLDNPTPQELRRFDKEAKPSIRWSLILARRWLENIQLVRPNPEATAEKKAAAGWLASLTGSSGNATKPTETVDVLQFHGRNDSRQLTGLLHFAQKIGWPDLDDITAKVSGNGITISDSIQSSPAETPMSVSTQLSSSYFANRRPGARRGTSTQKRLSAFVHSAGWLSNSYISGLIMPGESLSHFLISTLLEHDETAVFKLGDEANLCGGFIYSGKSFWSKACLVGRVLAARKGATECMGWVTSDVLPNGPGESWVDIEVDTVSQDVSDQQADKPRIWHKSAIETNGNVIGGADPSTVLPGDFVLPSNESVQQPLVVNFESLDLFAAADSVRTSMEETATPSTSFSRLPKLVTYSAMMKFTIKVDGEEGKEVNLALTFDIHFVTAHPCAPSSHTDVLKSPTSPSFHTANESPQKSPGSPGSPLLRGGHPLHKAFTYSRVAIFDVLSMSSSLPFSSLLSPPQSPGPTQSSTHTTSSSIPKVLVIDCTDTTTSSFPTRSMLTQQIGQSQKHKFGSDLEMLARALCAERGWNALVSRRGRGCLSCAIREASALGWRVVLRVA
ncbi:hypothetical protein LSUE1_G002654 [Lachnellula suecica]|uniref:Helicase-like protein n=1 Tax=Lachnellula suecica TaxID=602035 RepID=A0A8T9CC04_9HELO|nr:hypothetical protein LSUE1_G002654 [Lachnellula suecica]